jgi:hypothetical protein
MTKRTKPHGLWARMSSSFAHPLNNTLMRRFGIAEGSALVTNVARKSCVLMAAT